MAHNIYFITYKENGEIKTELQGSNTIKRIKEVIYPHFHKDREIISIKQANKGRYIKPEYTKSP